MLTISPITTMAPSAAMPDPVNPKVNPANSTGSCAK